MYENLNVEFDAGIVTITLNRPEKLNALAGHMRRDLAEALEHASSDPAARVVVITGAGRAFCAGADVGYMGELMERGDVEEFTRLLGAGRRVLTAMRQMLKPVVAAVNGPAYGAGFNIVLASDIRLAAESATFSQSFVLPSTFVAQYRVTATGSSGDSAVTTFTDSAPIINISPCAILMMPIKPNVIASPSAARSSTLPRLRP